MPQMVSISPSGLRRQQFSAAPSLFVIFVLFVATNYEPTSAATDVESAALRSCLSSIYACVPYDDSPAQTTCSDQAVLSLYENCTASASTTCLDSQQELAGRLGISELIQFESACNFHYCYAPIRTCYGSAFENAYRNKKFGIFCTLYQISSTQVPTCLASVSCPEAHIVDDFVVTLHNACASGTDGQCYVEAMTCINFAYFDPNTVDLVQICSHSDAARSCVDRVKQTSPSCSGASQIAIAAVDSLVEAYLNGCNQTKVCSYVMSSCLATTLSKAQQNNLPGNELSDFLCSSLSELTPCLNAQAECTTDFAAFLQELNTNCYPELCSAGVQFCFDAYNFNSSSLSAYTADQYLNSWCGAVSSIQSCLNSATCLTSDSVATELTTTLTELCHEASGAGSCYWAALQCIYPTVIQNNNPALFWSDGASSICSGLDIQAVSKCLLDAQATCVGGTKYSGAIVSINNALQSTCLPFCNLTTETICDDALTYYLTTVWSGQGSGLCGVLSERANCYSRFVKTCTVGLSATTVTQNVVVLNSLLTAIDEVCSTTIVSSSPCLSAAAQCFVTFVKSLVVSSSLVETNVVCTSWATASTCLTTALTSCSVDAKTNVEASISAVLNVVNSLSVCNPLSLCDIEGAMACTAQLTAQVSAVAAYQPPRLHDGKEQLGFCRKAPKGCSCQGSDTQHRPKICSDYDFFWGAICIDINATLACVTELTWNCTGAFSQELIATAEAQASIYYQQCLTVDYTCDVTSGLEDISAIIDLGLQGLSASDVTKPILCWYITQRSDLVWDKLTQCSPFVSQYFYQILEAFVGFATLGCSAPELTTYPPWSENLTDTCSMLEIEKDFVEFFEAVVNISVSVSPDLSEIVSVWQTLVDNIAIIEKTNVDYGNGRCSQVSISIHSLLLHLQIIINWFSVPPTCYLQEAFGCAYDFGFYVLSNGLVGSGLVNPDDTSLKDQFCFIAEEKFKCLVDATLNCDASMTVDVFNLYFQQQSAVGFVCVGPCDAAPCRNGGLCISLGSSADAGYRCKCPDGYSGKKCEIEECKERAALTCVKDSFNLIAAGKFLDFCSSINETDHCLSALAVNCKYSAVVGIAKRVFHKLVEAFVPDPENCVPDVSDHCSLDIIGSQCVNASVFAFGPELFDIKTGLLVPGVCQAWLSIAACIELKGCTAEYGALLDYFSTLCNIPPGTCSLRDLVQNVKKLVQKLWKIRFANPPKRIQQDIEDPMKELGKWECPCKAQKGRHGNSEQQSNGIGPVRQKKPKFNSENTLDDSGFNLDFDVCGDVGDAWNQTFEIVISCGDNEWNATVFETIGALIEANLGGGQCNEPCAKSCCQNGAQCIPHGYGYNCQCLSGFDGDCCEIETGGGCNPEKSSTCLGSLNYVLYNIFALNAASASNLCSDLANTLDCLSASMLPCATMDYGTFQIIYNLGQSILSDFCVGQQTEISCELRAAYNCCINILQDVYISPSGSICDILQESANCALNIKLQCTGSAVSSLTEVMGQSTWALYDSVCSPLSCAISTASDCITQLYSLVVFGIGSDDVCSLAAATVSCVQRSTVDCPSVISAILSTQLDDVLVLVTQKCIPDACGTAPCQSGGTCVPDSTLPSGFHCSCTIGWTGDYCEFVGCNYDELQACLVNVEAVFTTAWTDCPTINCLLVTESITCLSALVQSCQTHSMQLSGVLAILQSLSTGSFCTGTPLPCDLQPPTCPLQDIQKCFLAYVSLVMQSTIGSSGPEFGGLFQVSDDSYECLISSSTLCSIKFQAIVSELLVMIKFSSNCSTTLATYSLNYVGTTISTLETQLTMLPDIRYILCSNIQELLLVSHYVLVGCLSSNTAAQTLLDRVSTYTEAASHVCVLPCLDNPCEGGATCVSLPNGNFRCDCPASFVGDNCVFGQPNCQLSAAIDCLLSFETYISFGGASNAEDVFCSYTKLTLQCLVANTIDCDPGAVSSVFERFNASVAVTGFSCYSACDTRPCFNDGTCVPTLDSFTCLCPPGFGKFDCSSVLCDLSAVDQCLVPVVAVVTDGKFAKPDGFCGAVATTAINCLTVASTNCGAAVEAATLALIDDLLAALCTTSTCNLDVVSASCFDTLASLTIPLWNEVNKALDPNFCRKWSLVAQCIIDLNTCDAVASATTSIFTYLCPLAPFAQNCSISAITSALSELETYVWQAKQNKPKPPTSGSSSPPSPSSSQTSCGKTLTVDFAGSGQLYIDGVEQTLSNADTWSQADTIPLPSDARLIAIRAEMTTCGCYGGFLLYAADDYIVTSDKWKCIASSSLPDNWAQLDFNDLAWPSATVIGPYGEGVWGSNVAGVTAGTKANWIWTENNNGHSGTPVDSPVYCRGFFGWRTLSVRARNVFTAYIDGIEQTNLPSGDTTAVIPLPPSAKLIAITGSAAGANWPGILASVTGSVTITDKSWVCTSENITGWMNPETPTSDWLNAVRLWSNGPAESQLNGINAKASWIWTDGGTDEVVYCRRTIIQPEPVPVKSCAPKANIPDDGTHACWFVQKSHNTLSTLTENCDSDWQQLFSLTATDLFTNYSTDQLCANQCAASLCKNQATCVPSKFSFTCNCLPGYSGELCQIGEDCSRLESVQCFAQLQLIVNRIIADINLVHDAQLISDLATVHECLAVHLEPCSPVSSYIFAFTNIFIEYVFTLPDMPVPAINCEQNALYQCAIQMINSIYQTDSYDLQAVLTSTYQCAVGMRDTCGPSNVTTNVIWITWEITELLFPNPNCSYSLALGCSQELLATLLVSPSDRAVICPLLTTASQCVLLVVAQCDSVILGMIEASVQTQQSAALSLCVDACTTTVCLNGGTCQSGPGGQALCACATGYTGDLCQFTVGCNLDAVQTCLDSQYRAIINALLSPCQALDCTNVIAALKLCVTDNTAKCEVNSEVLTLATLVVNALSALNDVPGFCVSPFGSPTCVLPEPLCDYTLLSDSMLTLIQTLFTQYFNFPGPDLSVICLQWNYTLSVILSAEISCSNLNTYISNAEAWLTSLVGNTCSPSCPASGPLPVTTNCLTKLIELIDSNAFAIFATLEAHEQFCTLITDAGSCIQGSLDFCYDSSTAADLAKYTDELSTICPLPCLHNVCLDDAICVPVSYNQYRCECNPLSTVTDCDRNPTCEINSAYQCVARVESFLQTNTFVIHDEEFSKQFCNLIGATIACIDTNTATCDDSQISIIYTTLFDYQRYVNISCVGVCDSSPCLNNGVCKVDATDVTLYTCTCAPGFTGPTCGNAVCDINVISGCFYEALHAIFTDDIDELCTAELSATLTSCLTTATEMCPDSTQIVIDSLLSQFSGVIVTLCSESLSGNCSLSELYSTCFNDLLSSVFGYLSNPSTGQLDYICSLFASVDDCISHYGTDCQDLLGLLQTTFSVICVTPPNPECALNVVITLQQQLEVHAWQAENNWESGTLYDGLSYDNWHKASQNIERLKNFVKSPVHFTIKDDSLYACWYVNQVIGQIDVAVSDCADASWKITVDEGIKNITAAYLSDGACSHPCEPNLCLAGGMCTPSGPDGYGFTCQCLPGYTGDLCANGGKCDFIETFDCLQRLYAIFDNPEPFNEWIAQASTCSEIDAILKCLLVSFYPCGDYYESAFEATNLLLSYLQQLCITPPTEEVVCQVEAVYKCQSNLLSSVLSSSAPSVLDSSVVCLQLQEELDCGLSISAQCNVSSTGESLQLVTSFIESVFGSLQVLCPNPSCSLVSIQGCFEQLAVVIDEYANDTNFCDLVYAQKVCIETSSSDCPDLVLPAIDSALQTVLSSVSCVQPCQTLPCRNGAECHETSSTTFECICTPGFTGDLCQFETSCDYLSVGSCLTAATQSIVVGLLDPCKNPIDCSIIETLETCINNKTWNCDNITRDQFERILGSLNGIMFICDEKRVAPDDCETCDFSALQTLLLSFLADIFDQYTSVAGVDYSQICGSWNVTIDAMASLSLACSADYQQSITVVINWLLQLTGSTCLLPICFPVASQQCLNYMKSELAFIEAQPVVLPQQQTTFCLDMSNSRSCVVDNLDQCTDSSDDSILQSLNETMSGVLSFCVFPCLSDPCQNGGTCSQITFNSYNCTCAGEFTGPNCQYGSLYPYAQCGASPSSEVNCQGASVSQNVRLDMDIEVYCEQFSSIYISPSGYISFDNSSVIFDFQTFCSSKYTLLAPLFAWQDCSCTDSAIYFCVYYNLGTLDPFSAQILERATRDVRLYGGSAAASFTASVVVVITWENVYPNPCLYYKTLYSTTAGSTYQLVIAADTRTSYAIFNYEVVNVMNLVPNVFSGYTNRLGKCVNDWHPTTSADANILTKLQLTTGLLGRWFYPLFDSVSTCPPPKPEVQCLSYLSATVDLSVYNDRPPCPCNGRLVASDPRYHFVSVDWFRYCFAYNVLLKVGTGLRYQQMCCYNPYANDTLITTPPFAGYPTLLGASVSDYQIYQSCCVSSNKYCNIFLQLRPIDQCSTYYGPIQALLWGDPHFITMDNVKYTFNGIGEYTMLATLNNSFVLQTRTAQYIANDGTAVNASCFVAFAAREVGYPKVEIRLNDARNAMILLMNGVEISRNSIPNNDVYIAWDDASLNVSFPSGWTINVGLGKRLLTLLYTGVPKSAFNNTRGLLGLYDNNPNNDLMTPSGTILPLSSTTRDLHYGLGLKWQIEVNDSLFTYPAGKTAADYIQVAFIPIFDKPCNTSNDNMTAHQICGDNNACIYDYCVTLDRQLATGTLTVQTTYQANRQTLATLAPTLSIVGLEANFARTGRYVINATINHLVTFTLKATSPSGANVTIGVLGNVSMEPSASLDPATRVFRWTPTSLTPVDISFIAVDSNSGSASSVLQVTVTICNGCNQHGTCNFASFSTLGNGTIFQLADCICYSGWSGSSSADCSSNLNACLQSPCGPNNSAACTDMTPEQENATGLAYTCSSCPAGYVLDNQQCRDVDECMQIPVAPCNHICTNTYGSFICSCYPGYRLSGDARTCIDINECAEGTNICSANQTCVNTDGSYLCKAVCTSCGGGSYHLVIKMKFLLEWTSDYVDESSTLFRKLKYAIETVFQKLFTKSTSITVVQFFQGSVGVEFTVNFNATLSNDDVMWNAQLLLNYLNINSWKITPDNTVFYFVKEEPVISFNSLTVPSLDPCQSYTQCVNGGTCMSTQQNGIYQPPTCNCPAFYSGTYCEVPVTTGSTTQKPTSSINILAIVLPIVGAVLLIIILVVGILIYNRQRRSNFGHIFDTISMDEPLRRQKPTRLHQWWPGKAGNRSSLQ